MGEPGRRSWECLPADEEMTFVQRPGGCFSQPPTPQRRFAVVGVDLAVLRDPQAVEGRVTKGHFPPQMFADEVIEPGSVFPGEVLKKWSVRSSGVFSGGAKAKWFKVTNGFLYYYQKTPARPKTVLPENAVPSACFNLTSIRHGADNNNEPGIMVKNNQIKITFDNALEAGPDKVEYTVLWLDHPGGSERARQWADKLVKRVKRLKRLIRGATYERLPVATRHTCTGSFYSQCGGVLSSDQSMLYFISIIDTMTAFGASQQVNSFFHGAAASAKPAGYFFKRFNKCFEARYMLKDGKVRRPPSAAARSVAPRLLLARATKPATRCRPHMCRRAGCRGRRQSWRSGRTLQSEHGSRRVATTHGFGLAMRSVPVIAIPDQPLRARLLPSWVQQSARHLPRCGIQ